jgi:hypothetical protein
MGIDSLGLLAVLCAVFVAAMIVRYTRLPRRLKQLVYFALALRVVGALVRYEVMYKVYRGSGDAIAYFREGLRYSQRYWKLDFSPLYDINQWQSHTWWGTQFVSFPTSFILSVIGPTMLGAFIVFSLMSFLGLVGCVVAFRSSNPDVPAYRYARWVWLFPSLWYWPSSIGKEAIVMLGLGTAVMGFFGLKGKVRWPVTACGIFLVYAIRPQVAAVVVFSLVLAQWMGFGERWTASKLAQGVVILAIGLFAIQYSMKTVGMEDFDTDGVQSYVQTDDARRVGGKSKVDAVEVGLAGIPLAAVNVLARPFPFEAHNVMMLIASLEITGFWALACLRRKQFMKSLRSLKTTPLTRFAVIFVLVYSVALGMMMTNLGIIARQRVFIFPFLFMLLESIPSRKVSTAVVKRQTSVALARASGVA